MDEDQSIVLPDVKTETLIIIQSLLFREDSRVRVPSPELLSALSCLGLNVITRQSVSLSKNVENTPFHEEVKNMNKFICSSCGHSFGSLHDVQVHARESHVQTASGVAPKIENDKSCSNITEAQLHRGNSQ